MDGTSYCFDGFELDTSRHELRRAGECVPVEPRALDVLHHLIVNRDRVVSKEELLDTVWGDRFVSEAAVTTALRTARTAIGDTGREQRLIRTVFRRGYRFVGTVVQTAAGPDVPLPARLAAPSGLGFAGREHERAVLAAAAHREAVVLYGRCDEELSIPYQPWRELLTSLGRDAPDVLTGHREALAPLLGGTGAADLESDSARFALYSSVADVLDAVSARGKPALVVLDDLHWADAQTLALIRHLVETGTITRQDDGRWTAPTRSENTAACKVTACAGVTPTSIPATATPATVSPCAARLR